MNNFARGFAAISAALLAGGCGNGAQDDALALKIELNALKRELEYVRQQIEELDPRVQSAEDMAMQLFDEREAPLRLDCVRHTPGVLAARLASLTVICEGTAPSPGGHRIRLMLGNPSPARLDRIALTFYAGDGAARGRSDKRFHHEATASLAPGAWTSLEVELKGLDAGPANELALRGNVTTLALATR